MGIPELALIDQILNTIIQSPYPAITICFGGNANEKFPVGLDRPTTESNLRCKTVDYISTIVDYIEAFMHGEYIDNAKWINRTGL